MSGSETAISLGAEQQRLIQVLDLSLSPVSPNTETTPLTHYQCDLDQPSLHECHFFIPSSDSSSQEEPKFNPSAVCSAHVPEYQRMLKEYNSLVKQNNELRESVKLLESMVLEREKQFENRLKANLKSSEAVKSKL
ncbi:hypothetical protein [Parashewanella tropica]|uniref:hypothetical protein n=1 Tax=Parashewanella tropica TaxID=2547970 RepID=UPI00105A56AD|nr:hypothetical protein [Parashewanella tropica]